MRLNVLGLVSVDTLVFDNYTSYLGGGALSTAWIASLWEVPTTLYSISCRSVYNEVINRNLRENSELFSHIILSKDKPMTRFEISICNGDYAYKISNMDDFQDELRQFLNTTMGGQFIKLPARNFINLESLITVASLNPQGIFDLLSFTKKIHTGGFIFLNKNELLTASKQDFLSSLKYIENIQQSFIITLGECGAVCYHADDAIWFFCPSIQSTRCVNLLGCGDAFAGGFLAARVRQYSIADCMYYGTISAYLATYSPSNMVAVWLDSTYEDNIFGDLKKTIRYFEKADGVMEFLQSHERKSVVLKANPCISSKFNWKLKNNI